MVVRESSRRGEGPASLREAEAGPGSSRTRCVVSWYYHGQRWPDQWDQWFFF